MSSPREALRSRYVRAVMVSGLFSQIGIWVRNLSVLLFVMEQTGGNALAVSMISVAEYAPIFIILVLGGCIRGPLATKKNGYLVRSSQRPIGICRSGFLRTGRVAGRIFHHIVFLHSVAICPTVRYEAV